MLANTGSCQEISSHVYDLILAIEHFQATTVCNGSNMGILNIFCPAHVNKGLIVRWINGYCHTFL